MGQAQGCLEAVISAVTPVDGVHGRHERVPELVATVDPTDDSLHLDIARL